ncbi:19804_t:CDS:2 [Cetraspora pellucida]|uniref:19804_t:CDS:1 n=1 Tax=Cetraspora pellucida TaxID=1433469 RepID=A0A9N9EV47_9GLOM|nr:19804_t:CDS:2 [Cetraspora pellucida]
MKPQQSNNYRTFFNILEDNNLLTFNNNCFFKSYYIFVNSSLPKINTKFKEVAIEVVTVTRLSICKTNLVCVDTFYTNKEEDPLEFIKAFDYTANTNNWSSECKIKIDSDYLHKIVTSWHDEIKDNLVYWNR